MASISSSSATPFNIHNLPYGIITSNGKQEKRCATVVGDFAVDLGVLHAQGIFDGVPGLDGNPFMRDYLNDFAALPKVTRKAVRERLIQHLSQLGLVSTSKLPAGFIPLSDVTNHFPMDTRNFTDFYCSLEHTKNCTAIFRTDGYINPNWFTAPMAYNGRTSSLVVSGTPVHRPWGIFPSSSPAPNDSSNASKPSFQPETAMDFELEMGVFLTEPLARGEHLDINKAVDKIFGFVLLNDWSARNTQLFEMAPLGPFHGKGAGTSISPWIITVEALEPSLCPRKVPQEIEPLSHLRSAADERATYDIELSVKILRSGQLYTIGESNLNELYWTPFQQLTHLASGGEGLATGDIFGTGTISSARTNAQGEKIGLGCIFERKLPANKISSAPEDIAETYLQDGDRVIFEGWCRDPKTGEIIFGFGTCEGELLPAKQ